MRRYILEVLRNSKCRMFELYLRCPGVVPILLFRIPESVMANSDIEGSIGTMIDQKMSEPGSFLEMAGGRMGDYIMDAEVNMEHFLYRYIAETVIHKVTKQLRRAESSELLDEIPPELFSILEENLFDKP